MERSTRFVASYTRFSVAVVSLAILFIALNLVIYLVTAAWASVAGRTNPVSRKYGTSMEEYYPDLTAEQINDMLRVTWSLPPEYVPFSGRKVGPVTSELVNVSPHGFRLGRGEQDWPPDAASQRVIFVFGGSTAFGFGVPDRQTIPSYLAEVLTAEEPGTRPAVYNFGVPAANSTMERIQFEQTLAAGHVPDVAVFLDGLNDRELSHEPPETGLVKTLLGDQAWWRPSRLMVQLVRRLPLTRLASDVTYATGLRRRSGQMAPVSDELFAHRVIQRYLRNKRMVESVAREFGITPVLAWQPVPDFAYPAEIHPFADLDTPAERQKRRVYEEMARLYELGETGDHFVWCAELGRGATEPLYVDVVHYSARMSRMVAGCIAAHLEEQAR